MTPLSAQIESQDGIVTTVKLKPQKSNKVGGWSSRGFVTTMRPAAKRVIVLSTKPDELQFSPNLPSGGVVIIREPRYRRTERMVFVGETLLETLPGSICLPRSSIPRKQEIGKPPFVLRITGVE